MSDKKELPEAAKRALAEAEERRIAREAELEARPKELGGRDGPRPCTLRRLGEKGHRYRLLKRDCAPLGALPPDPQNILDRKRTGV